MHYPCWFKFGTSCVILLDEQLRIADELTGVKIIGRSGNGPVILPRFASPVISLQRKILCKILQGGHNPEHVLPELGRANDCK